MKSKVIDSVLRVSDNSIDDDMARSVGGSTPLAVSRRGNDARPTALFTVRATGAAAVLFSGATLDLIRERLHVGCSTGAPGMEGWGSWQCSDGIGYLIPMVALLGIVPVLVVLGAFVVTKANRSRRVRTVCSGLAAVGLAWVIGLTAYGSSSMVGIPTELSAMYSWFQVMLLPALISIVALLIALTAIACHGRVARRFMFVGAGVLGLATIVQPGLGIATIPAAGLLWAAGLRTADDRAQD